MNVAAFTLCGNDMPVLQPGFRLRGRNGADMWLPSKSPEAAAGSVELAWTAAQAQALPSFDRNSTLEDHLDVLRAETWGSENHRHLQIGVVEAALGRHEDAIRDLKTASRLYAEAGLAWCAACIDKSEALIDALGREREPNCWSGGALKIWRRTT